MWIDLEPELIEKVNERITTLIKMPETFYKAYMCLENSEAIQVLRKAAEAYQLSAHQLAITHYKNAITLLKYSTNTPEQSSLLVIIQYLISKCLIETSQLQSLIEAKDILLSLIKTTGTQYPMIYYLLSDLYIKTFCYKDAEKLINSCLSILNDSKKLTAYNIPTTDEIIRESTFDELSKLLVSLKDECLCWHRPDAICFMKNCNNTSLNNLSDRDIYFKSPAFNGLVVVSCNNNINPCIFNFHINCWKLKKEQLSPNIKLSDRDFLNWKCFTPNCERLLNEESVIRKIEIYNSDNTIKTRVEIPDKLIRQHPTPSKGAVRKQKLYKITSKTVQPESIVTRTLSFSNKERKKIKNSDEMTLIPHLIKLIQIRNANYGIEKGSDWRPDLTFYGNSEMMIDEEFYVDILEIDNDDLKQKKTFLYSYFYQYVSCNAPVKKNTLVKKWLEATELIGNCDSVLYELRCPNVIEFLLKSLKFAVIGEYVCTPATLTDAYVSVRNNICGTLKCLMNKNTGDDDSDDDLFDDNFIKNLSLFNDNKDRGSNTNEKDLQNIKNDVDCQLTEELINNQEDEKNVDKELIDNNKDIDLNVTDIKNNIEEKEVIENENDDTDKDKDQDEKIKLSDDNVKEKKCKEGKVCGNTRKKLENKLQKSKQELEETKEEMINLKMSVLRNSLYADYMHKKNLILFNIRLLRNEYAIVDKLQNILIYSTGTMLPINQYEWLLPLEQLQKLAAELEVEYFKSSAFISIKDNCMDLNSIECKITNLPPLPNRNITHVIQIAFDVYRNSFVRFAEQFKQSMPPSYPPGFNNNYNPAVQQLQMSQQRQPYFTPVNFTGMPLANNFSVPNLQQFQAKTNFQINGNGWNPVQFTENNIKVQDFNLKQETTNQNNGFNCTNFNSEFINHDKVKSKEEFNDKDDMKEQTNYLSYKEPAEVLNSDKLLKNFDNNDDLVKEFNDWELLLANKINPIEKVGEEIIQEFDEKKIKDQGDGEDEILSEKKSVEEMNEFKEKIIDNNNLLNSTPSMDKLINELRARNKGVLEFDLLCCVQEVRKRFNNSLTGFTFGKIILEVEKQLPSREKLQLSNYNNKIHDTRVNEKKDCNELIKRQRLTSASSTCSYLSAKSEQSFTSKKNPWAPVSNLQWSKVDIDQNECVICMETIVKYGKVPFYTLRCQHTFHKKCIKNWFVQNQSCPTCRIHSTIDDEFPPLP
ncbi:uncharacterized protein LOC130674647 [Microplitis mediator]|uniref:uncharacterized protein LOC130674647 n=1 Tax=Microplitis mediator TaxID=375433 RepID=UPI002554B28F|nr:uncharacterized protein LOC130674647 [Microplitis mediator]XP_057336026.1 uncharacterized protein LOC130674647 [Microplitis mediator]XP_057336027.1 uncharacterized protein LOC130674647 [Microplitis mediator]XP_057336028.1 uncharacterized protein LOC130674647 [Microplitis mediator]